jgi:hypothetical protein
MKLTKHLMTSLMADNPVPPEAFGPGCDIDWKNNVLYGADGWTYCNLRFRRSDIERLVAELKRDEASR